jgi:hypothetical protein
MVGDILDLLNIEDHLNAPLQKQFGISGHYMYDKKTITLVNIDDIILYIENKHPLLLQSA